MKNMKNFLVAGLALGVLGGVAISAKTTFKAAKAETATNYYLAFNDTNFQKTGDHGWQRLGHIRTQNETTWNGRFNALDSFFTGEGSGIAESETGYFDSVSWEQKKSYPYVYFTLAGNAANFIEVRKVSDPDAVTPVASVTNDQFNGNPMVVNYIQIDTSGLSENEELFLRIHDNSTSSYGFVTFGYCHVNASATDVSDAIWAHIDSLSIKYDSYPAENDFREANFRIRETMNFYLNGKASSSILTLSSNKKLSADEDFEDDDDFLDNWYRDVGHDGNTGYESGFVDKTKSWGTIISGADHHYNNNNIPFNKTGNGFFKGFYEDGTGFLASDNAKYRFVSKPFVLSGTGYISVKMAGRPASLHVVRGNTNLAYIDNKTLGYETNILNGYTPCTMVRHVINLKAFLGQVIQIAIADVDAEGNWGAVNFDELITKYNSDPTFKVDEVIQNSNHSYYLDKYVSGANTDIIYVDDDTREANGTDTTAVKAASDFLTSYYSTVRSRTNGVTHCGKSLDLGSLRTTYSGLSNDAKTVVNGSQDFDFGAGLTDENWFLSENFRTVSMLDSLTALGGFVGGGSGASTLRNATENNANVVVIVVIAGVSLICLLAFFSFKKKKENN